jgi:hypothetical protein
MKNGRMKN